MRFQIKPGYRHGRNDEFGAGDVVEMTEYEAGPIMHKLIELGEAGTPTVKSPAKDEPPTKKADK